MGSSKSSKSSKPSDISVPLILSFVAGFVTSRVMNNQDVITGSSVEGNVVEARSTAENVILGIIFGLVGGALLLMVLILLLSAVLGK